MKRHYSNPLIEVLTMETAGMLATSTDVEGDATGPALAPRFTDYEDED